MAFFDFNQTEILPYSKSNAAKRDSRIQENLKNLNESLRNEKEINIYKEQLQSDLLKEQTAKNLVNNRTLMRKRRLQEDIKIEKALTTKTLARYLAEMVISGLVFDEDFIEKQQNLKNNIITYVESMFDQGIINESNFTNNGSLVMESAYNELLGLVKSKIQNRDNVDIFSEAVIDEILSEAKKSKDTAEEIADVVKNKVEDTLKKEKKISKKKEEEKKDEEEMDEEMSDAADSLDDDDIEDNDSEFDDEDDMSDEELDALEKETDGDDIGDEEDIVEDDGLDDSIEGESSKDESEEAENADEELEDTDESEITELPEEQPMEEPEVKADAEQTSDNTMEITIKTDGKNVSVNANQSESTEFLNLFGKSRYEERNSKSLFRNLLEGNIAYNAKLLAESNSTNSGVKMDLVLAESIAEYTLLETMFTSKIFNLSASQLKSVMKTINFNRK